MGELSKMPNIGQAVEEQLIAVGINTSDDLIKLGAKAAWLKIQEIDESACIHRLMALEGAIQGVKKRCFQMKRKQILKSFIRNIENREILNNGGYDNENRASCYVCE